MRTQIVRTIGRKKMDVLFSSQLIVCVCLSVRCCIWCIQYVLSCADIECNQFFLRPGCLRMFLTHCKLRSTLPRKQAFTSNHNVSEYALYTSKSLTNTHTKPHTNIHFRYLWIFSISYLRLSCHSISFCRIEVKLVFCMKLYDSFKTMHFNKLHCVNVYVYLYVWVCVRLSYAPQIALDA